MASPSSVTIAPGAHIVVRDAVWRVERVNTTSNGKRAWHVVGVDEIVRDQQAIFLEEYEPPPRVLDPAETELELDTSTRHRNSLIYMEALLRDVPPTGPELVVGHRAAMDVLDYQLQPASRALEQPRQRILIADAVGLGKTLEAGILLSELIRRGRGKRILVATVKSILTQFQKEMWCRFAIPLVRLDTQGLHRIRNRIPTNHNPFHHFDRVIISIDTLKQNNAFRTHVERAWWDVVVIDEAHNVAARGSAGTRSQRSKIAEVLAERSDSLILLSATPHDGKKRSFASLMNMLDPTAIADPDDYGPADIQGLFVRRFLRDVQAEVGDKFLERTIRREREPATDVEEHALDALVKLKLTRSHAGKHGGMLFRTTLEKALFSSPAACLQTLDARLARIAKRADAAEFAGDVSELQGLRQAVDAIAPREFSRYRALLRLLEDKKQGLKWSRGENDRLVIFSERVETLKMLRTQLREDLGLKKNQVALLLGCMSDRDQQHIVEAFGQAKSKLRLLLASDVASEGLNLHHCCHRLIHFDIPWSLMVFAQRNGRIDRYGQKKRPQIVYLFTESESAQIKGDVRILELLTERDEQARESINDPSALMGVHDVQAEEETTAGAIEAGAKADDFTKQLDEAVAQDEMGSMLDLLLADDDVAPPPPIETSDTATLYSSDAAYVRAVLGWLGETDQLAYRDEDGLIGIKLPPDNETARRERLPGLDLRQRFRRLPPEILPDHGELVLTPDRDTMMEALEHARREEQTWPEMQFLWPLHPVVEWCNERARAAFGRHTAPVLTLREGLKPGEVVVVTSGLIPNRRGQPLVHHWFAARFDAAAGAAPDLQTFAEFAGDIGLGRNPLDNRPSAFDPAELRPSVARAIEATREAMQARRADYIARTEPEQQDQQRRLEELRQRQLDYADSLPKAADREAQRRRVARIFDGFERWVRDARSTEPEPFLQVIAVFRSEPGGSA